MFPQIQGGHGFAWIIETNCIDALNPSDTANLRPLRIGGKLSTAEEGGRGERVKQTGRRGDAERRFRFVYGIRNRG